MPGWSAHPLAARDLVRPAAYNEVIAAINERAADIDPSGAPWIPAADERVARDLDAGLGVLQWYVDQLIDQAAAVPGIGTYGAADGWYRLSASGEIEGVSYAAVLDGRTAMAGGGLVTPPGSPRPWHTRSRLAWRDTYRMLDALHTLRFFALSVSAAGGNTDSDATLAGAVDGLTYDAGQGTDAARIGRRITYDGSDYSATYYDRTGGAWHTDWYASGLALAGAWALVRYAGPALDEPLTVAVHVGGASQGAITIGSPDWADGSAEYYLVDVDPADVSVGGETDWELRVEPASQMTAVPSWSPSGPGEWLHWLDDNWTCDLYCKRDYDYLT